MNIRYAIVAASLAAACIPAPASAQDAPRFTAGVALHSARTWDDESFLGSGPSIEARGGVSLTPKAQVELAVTRLPYERSFDSGVATGGRSIFTALMLKYDFTRGSIRPFVMGGYGVNMHDGWRVHPPSGRSDTSSTDHGYVVGAGAVLHRGRWHAGPEVRVHMLAVESDASAAMMLTAGIRAGMRF